MNIIFNGHLYNKFGWNELLWLRALEIGDIDWEFRANIWCSNYPRECDRNKTSDLIWYNFPNLISDCEILSKIECRASLLKSENIFFKDSAFSEKCCSTMKRLKLKICDRWSCIVRKTMNVEERYSKKFRIHKEFK